MSNKAQMSERKSKLTFLEDENKKGIKNHEEAARHLYAAAKFHLDAAKNHLSGAHNKAATNTIRAQGHVRMAHELQREDAKHHAMNSALAE